MKHLPLVLILFFCMPVLAQETVKSLIDEGIKFHDAGNYEEAINSYKKALEMDSTSQIAHYEISISYLGSKDYMQAISHSEYLIEEIENSKYEIPAYMTIGSCLDLLGDPDQAIAVYKKALEIKDDNYLLYYNLALTMYNAGKTEEVEETLINGIILNPNHTSSHLLLGLLHHQKDNHVKSILALNFFLFLEPASPRSLQAAPILWSYYKVDQDKNKKNTDILINPGLLSSDDEFSAAELMLSMMPATNALKKNKKKSTEELFIMNQETLFNILGEFKENGDKPKDLWWEFYVTFYYKLSQSSHLETFCYFILENNNKNAADWLKENEDKVAAFNSWLGEN